MRAFSLPLFLISACSDYALDGTDEPHQATPDVAAEPMSLSFGALPEGDSEQLPLTVRNDGDAALEVAAFLLEGDAFTAQGVVTPFSLPAGESVRLIVDYTAITTNDDGALTILSSDPDSPELRVPLHGGYSGPRLEIDPPAFSFEGQLLDCTSEATFTLSSVGSEDLELGEITLGDAHFMLSEEPGQLRLAPGQSTTVAVAFTPSASSVYESALRVESNDPEGSRDAALYGVGDPQGACQALTLDFTVEHEVADIAFILDTTTSMGALAAAMGAEFRDIAAELDATIDDITFGAAVHRDYAPPLGTAGDLPFILLAQQTTDLARVQAAFTNIPLIGGGYDLEEASYEALYQAAAGKGYDQECDGVYDEDTDVLPFHRASDDAFGGSESGTYSSAAAGTGELGGMGFREGALPIIILATDAPQRDPDAGYRSPGGCPKDAGASDVVASMDALGARLIGIGVGWTPSSASYVQLSKIADRVVTWGGSGDVKGTIVSAVEALIANVTFDEVWLELASDEHSQVDAITPSSWTDVRSGQDITFTLTVNSGIVDTPREDTYPVVVEVYGRIDESTWLLDAETFHVVRPE